MAITHISSCLFGSMYPSITNCINSIPSSMPFSSSLTLKTEKSNKIDQIVQRRTANYKPNIWNYDLIQSLTSKYAEESYKIKAMKLKQDVTFMLVGASNPISKLELIDSILKLGLSNYFEEEIREALDTICSPGNWGTSMEKDLYATSLCFRLLRQYGYNSSEDMFLNFVDDTGKFLTSTKLNVKGLIELFHGSNLGSEGESILKEARLFSMKILRGAGANSDNRLAKQMIHALSLPVHWRVEWFYVKRYIYAHKDEYKTNSSLIELSKINFNIVQAKHQEDLKELSRWWKNLGLAEKLSFSRDRLVESFLYAEGVAHELQYGSLRKWLTKVIKLILIIDDVYDVYGSLDELECFSNAVKRWKPEEINELPECMKICFWTLFNTTQEIAAEIKRKKWAEFCNSLLQEAKWYNKGYTPSLKEYLDNGWISSSGPLLSLHVIFGLANQTTKDVSEFLKDNQNIIYCSSLLIRLYNDQGTSAAELERGDAPSSILCYMREANVTEEAAREHIRSIIIKTWRKINSHCITTASLRQKPVKYIINTARVAHFIYQYGDGFGDQDRETKEQVLSNLIEPLALS